MGRQRRGPASRRRLNARSGRAPCRPNHPPGPVGHPSLAPMQRVPQFDLQCVTRSAHPSFFGAASEAGYLHQGPKSVDEPRRLARGVKVTVSSPWSHGSSSLGTCWSVSRLPPLCSGINLTPKLRSMLVEMSPPPSKPCSVTTGTPAQSATLTQVWPVPGPRGSPPRLPGASAVATTPASISGSEPPAARSDISRCGDKTAAAAANRRVRQRAHLPDFRGPPRARRRCQAAAAYVTSPM